MNQFVFATTAGIILFVWGLYRVAYALGKAEARRESIQQAAEELKRRERLGRANPL